MKADEKIRHEIASAIEKNWLEARKRMETNVYLIETSQSVDNTMVNKKEFYYALVNSLPLSDKTYYFCCSKSGCSDCEYAKYHGKCSNEGSDYRKITDCICNLNSSIYNYYRGEYYKTENIKEINQHIAGNLSNYVQYYDNIFMRYTRWIREAESVEEIMEFKRELLINIISHFPTDSDSCYFCLYNKNLCSGCDYAVFHEGCLVSGSDYKKLRENIGVLVSAVDDYYKGEEYFVEEEYVGSLI